MGILAWLGLGLVAGFVASLLVNKKGEGMFMDIVLGIVGAVVGGFIAHFAGFSGITGFDIYSMLIAVGGAIVVLLVYHALARRTAEYRSPSNTSPYGRRQEGEVSHGTFATNHRFDRRRKFETAVSRRREFRGPQLAG